MNLEDPSGGEEGGRVLRRLGLHTSRREAATYISTNGQLKFALLWLDTSRDLTVRICPLPHAPSTGVCHFFFLSQAGVWVLKVP